MLNLILSYRCSKIKIVVATHVQIRSVHIQSQFKLISTNQSIFMSEIARLCQQMHTSAVIPASLWLLRS